MIDNNQKLAETMRQICRDTALPQAYENDVEVDIKALGQPHRSSQFVWVLRSTGTVLFPVGVGACPSYVTYWSENREMHGQEVKTYLIDVLAGTVKAITFRQAARFASTPPFRLADCGSTHDLGCAVNAMLEDGCKDRLWGVFNPPQSAAAHPSWSAWATWFDSTGNRLMADFMREACNLNQRLIHQGKSVLRKVS